MKNETGAMSFMTSNMKMETNTGGGLMKGPGRALFGEGLSFSKLTGPGKIWIQTMPLSKLAAALIPYIPTSSDSSDFGGLFD